MKASHSLYEEVAEYYNFCNENVICRLMLVYGLEALAMTQLIFGRKNSFTYPDGPRCRTADKVALRCHAHCTHVQ